MQSNKQTEFGALLRRYRTAAGLSQEALAERAGLSRRGIADLERRARSFPYAETIRRLADALALGSVERAALVVAARRQTPAASTDAPSAMDRAAGTRSSELTSFPIRRRVLVGREATCGRCTNWSCRARAISSR